jgi:hypothetical protein
MLPGPHAALSQSQLLRNPSFEGPTSDRFDPCEQRVAGELRTPDGWDPYFRCKSPNDPPYTNHRPEFGTIRAADFAYRVRSGGEALKYFNFFARSESAGVSQRVAVQPGQWLQFSLWVQLWTSACDASQLPGNNPSSLYWPGDLEARVCIDTDGGELDFDAGTVCSDWTRERAWDTYAQLKVAAQAKSSEVTVALNTRAAHPVKHNDVYADDAALVSIDAPPTAPTGTRRLFAPAVYLESYSPQPVPEPIASCPKPGLLR